ncbi:hypothetical protein BAY59_10760 [Prauserella coralliicola]|nr:hypothetical protein BAY59_10760 [Prauserella coralliicola]
MARPAAETIAEIIRDFGKIPLEFRQQARPGVKSAANLIVTAAKVNAAWSTRIPDAITARARLARNRQGVSIAVRRSRAPHGRAHEGVGTRGDTFRHPVFGTGDRRGAHSQDTWVSQRKRPYLFPAASKHREDVVEAVADALDKAARKHGWR